MARLDDEPAARGAAGAAPLTVRAPVRVDFGGGPSDVAPFCAQEWGYVVNGAIAKYATVRVRPRSDGQVVLTSGDLGVREHYPSAAALRHDTPLRLLTAAVALAGGDGGWEIQVQSDVPAGAGLGASAAVSVALLYALGAARGAPPLDRAGLARTAIGLETGQLQNVGGGQDQYAAAFGGLQSFHFSAGGVARRALAVAPATRRLLEESLLLCHSGSAHVSGAVLGGIMDRYTRGDAGVAGDLRRLRVLAQEIEALLLAGDLAGLGARMTAAWHAFSALHPSVSTPAIEAILTIALAAGATGGKALGAGGGGCVLLACDPDRRAHVAAALRAAGYPPIPFQFAAEGVTVVAGADPG